MIHRSGAGKTSVIHYVSKAVKYLCLSLKHPEVRGLLKGMKLDSLKTLEVDGGTIAAVENDLTKNTGTSGKNDGKELTAGCGVMFLTEAAQFIKSNSAAVKVSPGGFLCEVCV